jgi:hypothetical protein
MDLKEHASTSFTISPKESAPVSQWLLDVKKFFSTTALAVSQPETVFSSSTTNHDVTPRPDRVEDVLEGATIHALVHLISILGNVETDIRIQSTRL